MEDYRKLSLLFQSSSDYDIYNFIISNIKDYNSYDKIISLIFLRCETVRDDIIFNIDNKNITISLKIWLKNLINNYKDIRKTLNIDNILITVDYPKNFFHTTVEELILDTVHKIVYNEKELNVADLSFSEKYELFDNLSPKIMLEVYNFIQENINDKIILMEETTITPEISANLFDNSFFEIIKTLYNYYSYEDILETFYRLGQKISDLTFLSTRTPRDIDFFIKMYSEDIEKMNQ